MGAAHGERDAELAQAARCAGRVLGGMRGSADDSDQVRALAEQVGHGLVAHGPQLLELGVAGTPRAGRLGDQQRRVRADGRADQHRVPFR